MPKVRRLPQRRRACPSAGLDEYRLYARIVQVRQEVRLRCIFLRRGTGGLARRFPDKALRRLKEQP